MTGVVLQPRHHILQESHGVLEEPDGAVDHPVVHSFICFGAGLIMEAAAGPATVPAVKKVPCLKHAVKFGQIVKEKMKVKSTFSMLRRPHIFPSSLDNSFLHSAH